ncbi:hypothetical protein BDV97DRAFT_42881 [Delphinella strobiligena]|nr:hypothetical protein BDV97DRAFT_42881 [Delphinella strobiligena]
MSFYENDLLSSVLSQEVASGYDSFLFPNHDGPADMDYNVESYFEGDNDGEDHNLPSDIVAGLYDPFLDERGYANLPDHHGSDIGNHKEQQDTWTKDDHRPQLHAFEHASQNIPRPSLEDAIETIKQFPSFIDTNSQDVAIAGHMSALESFALAMSSMAKVQIISTNDPYNAYLPLQIALRQLYFDINLPNKCPSALDLCTFHRSPRHEYLLKTVALKAGTPLPPTAACLDLNSMTALLRLLASRDNKDGEKKVFYQLGLLTFQNGVFHARIYPMNIPDATGTAWLYFGPNLSMVNGTNEWFGLCSEEAFMVQDNRTSEVLLQQTNDVTPIISPSQHLDRRARPLSIPPRESVSRPRSTSTKRKANAEATLDDTIRKKRKTASQIQELHNEFPASRTPTQILDEKGDTLHYNNLLRVAVWFGNNDIFQRLNAIRRNKGKEPYTALSAITKRIGVACKYLADEHDLDPTILRTAFNAKRAENKISIRDTASSDLNISDEDGGKVFAALGKILSASAHSGLIKYRDMKPILSTHTPRSPKTTITNPGSEIVLGRDMMHYTSQNYTHTDYADENDQFEPSTSPTYNLSEASILYNTASTYKLDEQLHEAAASDAHIHTHGSVSRLPKFPVSYNNISGSGQDQYTYQPQLLQPDNPDPDNYREVVGILMDDITHADARSGNFNELDRHETETHSTDHVLNDSVSPGHLTQLISFGAEPGNFAYEPSIDYVPTFDPLSEPGLFDAEWDNFTADFLSHEPLSDFAFG